MNKEEAGVVVNVKKPSSRKPKVPEPSDESEEDEPPKKFQGRKPKLEMDDLDEKVKKLEKLNTVIESNNPWLARILESRTRH